MSQDPFELLQRALENEKTARKEAEKKLELKTLELNAAKQYYTEIEKSFYKKDSQLQGVFENILDAYVIMDLSGNTLKMNDAAANLLGFDDTKIDFNLLELSEVSEREKVKSAFKSLLKTGSLLDFQLSIITKKNIKKLIHINASVIYDQGDAVAFQGIVRDITKAKEAETQLIESENRLAALILNLETGVLLKDENQKIVLANTKFCELFNIDSTTENLKGQIFTYLKSEFKSLFLNPDEFERRIKEIAGFNKNVYGDELHMTNGQILERDCIRIYDNDVYKGSLWTYRDVTLKRNYRRRIESQRQKYRGIITNMHLGLIEVDCDYNILMVNQAFSLMAGYSEQELIGKTWGEIMSANGSSKIIEEERIKREKGESSSYEIQVRHKTGDIRYWLVSGAPNYDLSGNRVGSIGVHLDITDLKNLELQKEKLLVELGKSNDELQEYAYIVSHDLKSPLRSINALTNWLREDNVGKLDEGSIQNLALIEETIGKMDQLISDVLEYSSIGSDTNDKTEVDLEELLVDLLKIMYKPEHIEIEMLNKLPVVIGDKTKLQQVFQNLISNAIKFIDKEKGFIKIEMEELDTHYKFSIADNGIGIEEQFHSKIFKVFHTLNQGKDSTGIGLSIVKKIIDLHKGEIWLKSEINMGTTFFFTLKK